MSSGIKIIVWLADGDICVELNSPKIKKKKKFGCAGSLVVAQALEHVGSVVVPSGRL